MSISCLTGMGVGHFGVLGGLGKPAAISTTVCRRLGCVTQTDLWTPRCPYKIATNPGNSWNSVRTAAPIPLASWITPKREYISCCAHGHPNGCNVNFAALQPHTGLLNRQRGWSFWQMAKLILGQQQYIVILLCSPTQTTDQAALQ